MVEVVESWNGRLACALQAALHMSNEAFAQRIGAHVRTIAGWHESPELVPRPDMQQALDTLLASADEGVQARFAARISGTGRSGLAGQFTARPRHEMTAAPSYPAAAERDMESSRRTLLAQSLADGEAPPEFPLLELAETIRREMEDTLAAGTVSPARLATIEETIASHVRVYTTTPPAVALTGLLLEVMDVQRLMAGRQPASVLARLSEMTAMLATLAADSLMKLGRIGEAGAWYGTAKIAADGSRNKELRARVRAQHAMLPYYYGPLAEAVHLAREAQEILGDAPRAVGAFAAAAEARALARMGNRAGAEAAMARAQDLAERVHEPDDDEAFRFGERRHLFYLSGALTNLGDGARADGVQARALELYGDASGLIDPALIRLDQAHLLVFDHDLDGACALIRDACLSLGSEYRTRVLSARVKQIVDATPREGQARRVLDGLHRELFPRPG